MNKTYLIILISLFFIIILINVVISLIGKKSPSSQKININSPTPTTYQTNSPSITKTPSKIIPTFTGVSQEEIPPTEKSLIEEKNRLRKIGSVNQEGFHIKFDYLTDKFNVNLDDPKNESLIKFNQWLEKNYKDIPIDRFEIK